MLPQRYIFSSKSQHLPRKKHYNASCCCYHKGTYFQANHNYAAKYVCKDVLLLLPQRYIFSSKSQRFSFLSIMLGCCCCYHKGTYFQANHNITEGLVSCLFVVVATTKVHIFKQITTTIYDNANVACCCCYHKGTYFQANHNLSSLPSPA